MTLTEEMYFREISAREDGEAKGRVEGLEAGRAEGLEACCCGSGLSRETV